jgi:hypothetical protein
MQMAKKTSRKSLARSFFYVDADFMQMAKKTSRQRFTRKFENKNSSLISPTKKKLNSDAISHGNNYK